MDDKQIVSEFKEQVLKVYPEAEVHFYGSRVSRTHNEDSDYDILVVLDKVGSSIRDTVYDIAWEIGFKYDAFLAPVLAEKQELITHPESQFFNNVKQYGMVI